MSLPKIGKVIKGDGGLRWIVTGRFPHGIQLGGGGGFAVLTPVPDGCEPKDLGSRFIAAEVTYADVEMTEKLHEWPSRKRKTR